MIFLEIVFVMCIITVIIAPFAIELFAMYVNAMEMEGEENGIY